MNVIVLAGYQNKKNAFTSKASMHLKGKPMLSYVMDALKNISEIQSIVVVGKAKSLRAIVPIDINIIEQRDNMFNNFLAGAEFLNSKEGLLVITCDIPLINSEAIKDFLSRATSTGADLCYPIIHKKLCEERFPLLKRTYVDLVEGTYTGGNIIYINPLIIDKIEHRAKELIKYRKNPFFMAYSFGPIFLLRLLLKRLTIRQLEENISKTLSIRARAIISKYPELGCDVDKEDHLKEIEKYII